VSSYRDVRYVVSRLKDPDDVDSVREPLGCYPFLELAMRHADREGAGTCVDAEGGTYHLEGPHGRRGQWLTEWTNLNLYQGAKKRSPQPSA
jgi:hypothetical protein